MVWNYPFCNKYAIKKKINEKGCPIRVCSHSLYIVYHAMDLSYKQYIVVEES